MYLNGAQILIESLIEQGVDKIFGYPGGAVLNIYDALADYQDKITHILTSHEQGAGHAADGYARATGKVGVVLATSGPGATNLVTSIATANMDSVPLVAITGNVSSALIGTDSFQEVDISGIVMPITKYSFLVRDITKLHDTIREAFRIAQSGRKGAVLVDITSDVTKAMAEYTPMPKVLPKSPLSPSTDKIAQAVSLIDKAKRPLILFGGGVQISRAGEKLLDFATKCDIPFCHSFMGVGQERSDLRLNLGLAGMNGKYSANKAIYNADVLIAIGTRFSDRVATNNTSFAEGAKVVHIDMDIAEIDKNIYCTCGIVGDAGQVLAELCSKCKSKKHSAWLEQIAKWQASDYAPCASEERLSPYQIVLAANEYIAGGGILVTDVGQHQVWTAQFSDKVQPNCFLTPGGLGTMGFGLGASIGAKIAFPNKKVVLCTGDGSFHMNMSELATCVNSGLDIVVLVFDNQTLGMVRQFQAQQYDKRYFATEVGWKTDYVKLAEAFGADGYRVSSAGELREALDKAGASHKVTVIDCVIDKDEMVLPVIPAGKTIDDIIM